VKSVKNYAWASYYLKSHDTYLFLFSILVNDKCFPNHIILEIKKTATFKSLGRLPGMDKDHHFL